MQTWLVFTNIPQSNLAGVLRCLGFFFQFFHSGSNIEFRDNYRNPNENPRKGESLAKVKPSISQACFLTLLIIGCPANDELQTLKNTLRRERPQELVTTMMARESENPRESVGK